jgi:endogenous inhibitor of DNA gyrase (YacG/DUF329 family)
MSRRQGITRCAEEMNRRHIHTARNKKHDNAEKKENTEKREETLETMTTASIDLSLVSSGELARELRRRASNNSFLDRRVYRPCSWCGLPFYITELRKHRPGCSLKPQNIKARELAEAGLPSANQQPKKPKNRGRRPRGQQR